MAWDIREDDLRGTEIAALLHEHVTNMHQISPRESVHALDLEALKAPEITFWSVWQGEELLGCGALKELDPKHGEIKSMRTASRHRRKGVAAAVVTYLLTEAARRGYQRLSLETGATEHFAPARALYARFGFEPCGPFDGYAAHPHSAFMTRRL